MKKILSIASTVALMGSLFAYSFSGDADASSKQTVVPKTKAPVAVFYSPHQDDELLTMGVGIMTHIKAGNDVHVVLYTDGAASKVISTVNQKRNKAGFTSLSVAQFSKSRNDEFYRSVVALGVKPSNIHFEYLKDGATKVSDIKNVMLKYEKNYPNARHKAFSYIDNHPDHANGGKALFELYKEGKIKDARFYLQDDEFKAKKVKTFLSDNYDKSFYPKLKQAADSYMIFNPAKGYNQIGYTSVKASFDIFLKNPQSRYHKPYQNL